MGLKFQNFTEIFYLVQKFSEKDTLRETNFAILHSVFATLPGTRGGENGTLTSGTSP